MESDPVRGVMTLCAATLFAFGWLGASLGLFCTEDEVRRVIDLDVRESHLSQPRTDSARLERFVSSAARRPAHEPTGQMIQRSVESSVRKGTQMTNATLDGQTVRMPGYMLPLEFSDKKVSEFLLIPWVGACIHTPPPPPNQIVHVKVDKPVEFGGLFTPVWVTGQMGTGAAKKSLYLIDGTSDIDVGYSLRASQVEAYKE